MAEKEYTELQLKAKEEGIKSWHVKSDDVLSEELAEKRAKPVAEDEVVVREAPKAAPAPVAPKPAPPKPEVEEAEGNVTFYWKGGRNIEFSIETKAATKISQREAVSFASTDSVLVLDSANPVEKQAIAKLRKDPMFKIDFDEVEHRRVAPDKKGAKLDELMELDKNVLVQMVGGSVQDNRKTRGELIQQIMAD